MQNVIVTDFTAGELSEKLSGRIDLAIYSKGSRRLENFIPFAQGGITLRPGTKHIGTLATSSAYRLIPWTVADGINLILELSYRSSSGHLQIWMNDSRLTLDLTAPWIADNVQEIQYATTYEAGKGYMVLAHPGFAPQLLTWTGTSGTEFSLAALNTQTKVKPAVEGGTEAAYSNVFPTGDYPRAVAFFAGRLWLGGSTQRPQMIWASKLFNPTEAQAHDPPFRDFRTYERQSYTVTKLALVEGSDTPTTTTETINRDIVADDHAISLELASDQNDAILWIAADQDLIVGTTTGEWILSGNTTATQALAQLMTRYGSSKLQARKLGTATLFFQGKRLREYLKGDTGFNSPDLAFQNDEILTGDAGTATVVQYDFAQTPSPVVHIVLSDGTMASILYDRQHGALAWYRTELTSTVLPSTVEQALIKSVAVIPSSTGEDVIYLAVQRNGTVRLEAMQPVFSGPFLDAHKTFDSVTAITGMTHLYGLQTYVYPTDRSVAAALITIASDGTAGRPSSMTGKAVTVGAAYAGTFTSNRVVTSMADGIGIHEAKRIASCRLRLYQTDALTLVGAANEALSIPSSGYSGIVASPFPSGWSEDATWGMSATAPSRATILGATIEVEV